jgi:SWI/SNF-related matrix-associated actin-dependent regulator 1 of chromatin subfamily A
MSDWDETPEKKPVVQVPDSSPLNRQETKFSPKLLFSKPGTNASPNLREKFGFNGTNLLSNSNTTTAATLANRDMQILQNMFKSVSFNLVRGVYITKAGKDLKMAKQILTKLVEKRKKDEGLRSKESPSSQVVKPTSPSTVAIPVSSSPSKRQEIEISSSPDVSPVKSSKVVLDKTKSISQKYSAAYRQREQKLREDAVIIEDESPKPKKRKLVRGTKESSSTPEVIVMSEIKKEEVSLLDDDEEGEEEILKDEFTDDSDVESDAVEATSSMDTYYENKVLEFFNSADDRDIVDIAQCSLETSRRVIAKRPFRSINQFESLNFDDVMKRKAQGELFSSRANLALRGYAAVESLVKQCNSYSETIAHEVSKWGVKVHGVNDELEIVEVDVEDQDDDDDLAVGRKQKSRYFKHKPKLLSEDIELKNYQQVGLNWLYLLYTNQLSCILADEMGLGKTCQVIAFLSYLKEIGESKGPHLVVVPSSTLENWMREFHKFAPTLVVEPYYGSQKEREETRHMLVTKWSEIDVIVTTYNLATVGKDDFSFLKHGGFNVIVFDEGHMLKNSMSDRFVKLMKLRANFRLLLTGTPLQNNLRELMSLLEFILPSIFVSKKEDLKYVFNQKTTTKDSTKSYNPLLSERAIEKAKKMMAPFILRRRKDQVLKHLPKKIHSLEYCHLSDSQKIVYQREIQRGIKLREAPGTRVANILMGLRKAAIHPMLFRSQYDDAELKVMAKEIMKEDAYVNANETYILEDMQVMTDFELNNLCRKFPSISKFQLDDSHYLDSGKVRKLGELLPGIIESGGKVLIFSLFTQVLDILEPILSMWNIKFLRLDGSTQVDMRQDLIDKFYEEDSIPVFLLSTKAGGFGINLVCANNVIIFDQSFNPHDDKQAEDRAHRVGQEREVNVIRLLTKDSIEESMYLLAQNKLELDQTMSGDQIENKAMSFIDKMVFER